MFSEMAKPAASSLALLIRKPEDSLCMEVERDFWVEARLRCAFKDCTLVLITNAMVYSSVILFAGILTLL
jgi:hypothetical protein